MHVVIETWDRALATQPAPPFAVVAATLAVALIVILPQPAWLFVRHAVTIAHEGGHALVAIATGRRLAGLRLHADSSGLTTSIGRERGLGMILTAAAGYVAPSLLGLGAAALLASGHITATLWAAIVLLAALLLMVRNLYGVLSLVVTGAVVFGVSWFTPPLAQAAFAYFVAWFLLVAGVRGVLELQQQRRAGWTGTDADQLAYLTHLPGVVWVAFFLMVDAAALATAARWFWP